VELRRRRPDAEAWPLLLQLSLAKPPTSDAATAVAVVRRDWQIAVEAFATRRPVAALRTHQIPGPTGDITVDVYTPRRGERPRPVLVWFHGGGFVFGNLDTAGATCRALASRTGAIVVAVDYRLAPEHPLEAGLADCIAAVRWSTANAVDLGGDAAKLAVGGDSAGGGLAALVAQHCARGGPPLAAQLLVYPATDLTGSCPSANEDMIGPLNRSWMSWIRTQISTVSDLSNPALSALHATDIDAAAPAIVLTAGFDPLRDEGLAYAYRLRGVGVPVRLLHYPGQFHGFVSFDRVLSAAREALDRLSRHLRHAFEGQLRSGTTSELGPRSFGAALWWRPGQRWHESKIAVSLIRERRRRRRVTPRCTPSSCEHPHPHRPGSTEHDETALVPVVRRQRWGRRGGRRGRSGPGTGRGADRGHGV
jgi:acetyl esterase